MKIKKTKRGTTMVTTSDYEPLEEKKRGILTTASLPSPLPIQQQEEEEIEEQPESEEQEELREEESEENEA